MKKFLPMLILIIFGMVARWLPHPANFAPIGAIAMFGALYLPKKWALIMPIAAMLASDLLIGFYSWPIMASVYLGFITMGLVGLAVRRHKNIATIIGGTLAGSVMFFLLTNFSVWAFSAMYDHNLAGLMQSYYLAIPFFRNSALGDLFYTGALVGAYEAVLFWQARRQPKKIFSSSSSSSGN